MDSIDSFISELSNVSFANTQNPYADKHYGITRQNNLKIYLQTMKATKATTLLVGEAPGYLGCALTGVPFTSEYIMLNGVRHHKVLGRTNGYQKASGQNELMKENTATMVWNTIDKLKKLPVLWNAFPLHPHKAGDQKSNRPPAVAELQVGLRFLEGLIDLFRIDTVIAIGNKADTLLSQRQPGVSSLKFDKVRHPSMGGKSEFEKGIYKILT